MAIMPTKQPKSTICLFSSRIGLLLEAKLGNCRIPIARTKAGMLEYANNSLEKGKAVNIGGFFWRSRLVFAQ